MNERTPSADAILKAALARLGELAAAKGAAAPGPQDDLFLSGILDSVSVVDFILELEARFDFRFTQRDFEERGFATPRGMAGLAALRLAERAAERAGPDVGPDVGTDAGQGVGADARTDVGADMGADMGEDAG